MTQPATDLAHELRETITWIEERADVAEQLAARINRAAGPGLAAALRVESARMRGRAKLLRLAVNPVPAAGVTA